MNTTILPRSMAKMVVFIACLPGMTPGYLRGNLPTACLASLGGGTPTSLETYRGSAGGGLPGGGQAVGSHRLAERPDCGREQGDVLDKELAEDTDGREPPDLVGPGPRRRHQEAEGAQEHPDRQQAADGRQPGEPGAGGDQQADQDL